MGGCVSSPKDVPLNEQEEAPVETPKTPENAESKLVVAQENNQEEAEKNEETLVDVSESKEEEKVEAKVEEAEVVPVVEAKEPEKEEAKPEQEQPKAEDKTETPIVTL